MGTVPDPLLRTLLAAAGLLAMVHLGCRLRAEYHRNAHDEAHTPRMSPGCTSRVPGVLYVYSDPQRTAPVNATIARNPRFKLRQFTPALARAFVRAHCPHALGAFDMVVPHAFKADMFRYCALYTTGGVYADDDLDVVVPFEALVQSHPGKLLLIEDTHFINLWSLAPRVVRHAMWNAFMVAREPGSDVLHCALAVSTSNVLMRKGRLGPLQLTGPEVLYGCLRRGSDAAVVGWLGAGARANRAFDWGGRPIIHHVAQPRTTEHYGTRRHWFTSQ